MKNSESAKATTQRWIAAVHRANHRLPGDAHWSVDANRKRPRERTIEELQAAATDAEKEYRAAKKIYNPPDGSACRQTSMPAARRKQAEAKEVLDKAFMRLVRALDAVGTVDPTPALRRMMQFGTYDCLTDMPYQRAVLDATVACLTRTVASSGGGGEKNVTTSRNIPPVFVAAGPRGGGKTELLFALRDLSTELPTAAGRYHGVTPADLLDPVNEAICAGNAKRCDASQKLIKRVVVCSGSFVVAPPCVGADRVTTIVDRTIQRWLCCISTREWEACPKVSFRGNIRAFTDAIRKACTDCSPSEVAVLLCLDEVDQLLDVTDVRAAEEASVLSKLLSALAQAIAGDMEQGLPTFAIVTAGVDALARIEESGVRLAHIPMRPLTEDAAKAVLDVSIRTKRVFNHCRAQARRAAHISIDLTMGNPQRIGMVFYEFYNAWPIVRARVDWSSNTDSRHPFFIMFALFAWRVATGSVLTLPTPVADRRVLRLVEMSVIDCWLLPNGSGRSYSDVPGAWLFNWSLVERDFWNPCMGLMAALVDGSTSWEEGMLAVMFLRARALGCYRVLRKRDLAFWEYDGVETSVGEEPVSLADIFPGAIFYPRDKSLGLEEYHVSPSIFGEQGGSWNPRVVFRHQSVQERAEAVFAVGGGIDRDVDVRPYFCRLSDEPITLLLKQKLWKETEPSDVMDCLTAMDDLATTTLRLAHDKYLNVVFVTGDPWVWDDSVAATGAIIVHATALHRVLKDLNATVLLEEVVRPSCGAVNWEGF